MLCYYFINRPIVCFCVLGGLYSFGLGNAVSILVEVLVCGFLCFHCGVNVPCLGIACAEF